jgi:hypothetical protein
MTRTEKLEVAVKAALRLRRFIETPHEKIAFKALLVPVDEVKRFDKVIEELSMTDKAKF